MILIDDSIEKATGVPRRPATAALAAALVNSDASASRITGLVLAGGAASRMQGVDKGLLPLRGRPLLAHVVEALAPQVAVVLVSANRNLDRHAAFGAQVVADPLPEPCGPLGGMLAGLQAAHTEWVWCVPCDMPQLPPDLGARLLRAATTRDARAAYATSAGDAHYTCCLLRRDLAAPLRDAIADGTRAVHRFLAQVDAISVALPKPLPNLNTPQALAAAQG